MMNDLLTSQYVAYELAGEKYALRSVMYMKL